MKRADKMLKNIKETPQVKILVRFLSIGIALLVVVAIVFSSSIFTIDAGEKGVKLRTGSIVGTLDSGLHFKLPVLETVKVISTRSYIKNYHLENSYSKDQQPANIRASVTFSVPETKVTEVYEQYKTISAMLEATMDRQVYNQIENTFGRYSSIEVVNKREQFVADVISNLRKSLESVPINVELVQVESIKFSQAYEKSVELRMQAEVEVETQRQNLAKEKISAEIMVTKSKGEADSRLQVAKAEAEAIEIKGLAEAKAIQAKSDALNKNPRYAELIIAERWNGALPSTMTPSGTVPLLNLTKPE